MHADGEGESRRSMGNNSGDGTLMKCVTAQKNSRPVAKVVGEAATSVARDPVHARIVLIVAGLLVLIIGFFGFFAYQGWQRSRVHATVNTLNLVNLLERQIYDSLSKVDFALQTAEIEVERELVSGGMFSSAQVTEFLSRQQELLPEVLGYRGADADGIVRYGSGSPDDHSINILDRDYFQKLRDDPGREFVLFGPIISVINHRWVIGLARPLHSLDGKFAGVLYASIPVDEFQQKLQFLNLGRAGAVTLRMADMSLVARVSASSRPGGVDIGSREVSAVLKAAIADNPIMGNYVAKTALDQIERVNAYIKVAQYPMYVIVGLATDDTQAEWRNQAVLILLLGLMAIGATALGAKSIASVRRREFQRRLNDVQRTADTLQAQEAQLKLYASVFTHAREGIMITDAEGAIVEVNDTFTHLTGYRREEIVSRNPRVLSSGRQSPEFYAALWQSLREQGYWSGELWDRKKDGTLFAAQTTISAVRGENGETQNYVALISDITLMKNHQQQLEHVAHHDALTGLPNRVLLGDRLRQAIVHSQRHSRLVAVAFLDLDGFKNVNDLHGHEVGDALLIAVATSMKTALREGDTLARIGGDQFVAVLCDLSQIDDARPVLQRLLQAASQPVAVSDCMLHVTASIGVATYPPDGSDPDFLLRAADRAMYRAKQLGRNQFHFFEKDSD